MRGRVRAFIRWLAEWHREITCAYAVVLGRKTDRRPSVPMSRAACCEDTAQPHPAMFTSCPDMRDGGWRQQMRAAFTRKRNHAACDTCYSGWRPCAHVQNTPGAPVWAQIELPGVTADEIDVSLCHRLVVTVSGVSAGRPFYREITLPGELDEQAAAATMAPDRLTVTMPASSEQPRVPTHVPVTSHGAR